MAWPLRMLAVVSPFLSRPCVDVGGELCPVLRLRPLHGSRQHGIDQPADRSRQGGLASDVAGVASAGRNSSKVSMVVTGNLDSVMRNSHLGSIHFREHARRARIPKPAMAALPEQGGHQRSVT